MIDTTQLLNFSTIIMTILMPALGVSIGQSMAGRALLQATYTQPSAQKDIFNILILGMALMETAEIIGLSLGILLIIDPSSASNLLYPALARFGIIMTLCLPSLFLGIVCAWPTMAACRAVARQPFFSGKILNLLIITQSLLQTPVLFCFLIAWFIKVQAPAADTLIEALRIFSGGLAMGLGSIGPIIGLALFAKTAVSAPGINRKSYAPMFSFTFISEAIIETPILLVFIIAALILGSSTSAASSPIRGLILLASAVAAGLGTLLPGINSGRIAAVAAEALTKKPDELSSLPRSSVIAQALMDTFVIYAAIVSIMIFVSG